VLHNDRSGNDLFCSLMLQARVYSKCNPYGSHKSMEVYRSQVQCERVRQASEKSEPHGTWLAPTEGKLRAGRKDESNFVSSIRIGV
jgi:hypothetical protein